MHRRTFLAASLGGMLLPAELWAAEGRLQKTSASNLQKVLGSTNPELVMGLAALEHLQQLSQKSLAEQEAPGMQAKIRAGLRDVGAMLETCLVRMERLLELPEERLRPRLREGRGRLPHRPRELDAAVEGPALKPWLVALKEQVQAEIRAGTQRRIQAGAPDPLLAELALDDLRRTERLEGAGWTIMGVCGVVGAFMGPITLLLVLLLSNAVLLLVLVNLLWVAPAVLVGLPLVLVGQENRATAERSFLLQQQVFEGEVGPVWVDTGLQRSPGYQMMVYTTGFFWDLGSKIGPNGNGKAAPEGSLWPGGPVGGLIGRIGAERFMLGSRERVPTLDGGSLELAINVMPGMDSSARLRARVLLVPTSMIDELPPRWPVKE